MCEHTYNSEHLLSTCYVWRAKLFIWIFMANIAHVRKMSHYNYRTSRMAVAQRPCMGESKKNDKLSLCSTCVIRLTILLCASSKINQLNFEWQSNGIVSLHAVRDECDASMINDGVRNLMRCDFLRFIGSVNGSWLKCICCLSNTGHVSQISNTTKCF